MNSYFDTLGSQVLERWREVSFSLEAFPEVARVAIEEWPPAGEVEIEEMMREFLLNDEQPLQSESGFGQPELVAFNHERFYIQVLFWLDGTTDIHQHAFSGAFHVMHGSSIHAEFDFANAQAVTPHLQVGDLKMRQVELLETGRTVAISSGQGCIHSLFHLDTPSVTMVVRTHNDEGAGPQFNYLPPRVAIDPLREDALTMRRKQLLGVLETLDHPEYGQRVEEMVARLDFERGFHVLQHSMGRLLELDEWEPTLLCFQEKHGELAMGVAETLKEGLRRETIAQLRYYIEDPEHRFFLALLMNVPTRDDIFAFVGERFDEQSPTATILGWLRELIEPSESGAILLDAVLIETFDLDTYEQAPFIISTLRPVLEGDRKSENLEEEPYEILATLKESCLRPLFE
ncbi:MAG: hypothetical protein ACSHYB_05850 [Roseibacillus sp.]